MNNGQNPCFIASVAFHIVVDRPIIRANFHQSIGQVYES
ncbi:hypothetical protein GAGA_2288 [Paraglaciecola agarilytica NO2]|uniref:Uncharacterized protein n=1 Tax=Paraglaciecola agarilytica NO2 TaxID=1125747 RepID=A0ABQ0I765_9ALTE|nr:hypothetical protein GAGA_2288 [Paraglaciecola agarilytica NO2]